jgi:23S rRNA G2069 N7-methylase RlmK/C1962 C5-methylase RlmI
MRKANLVRLSDYNLLLAEYKRLKVIVDQVDDVLVVNWVGPRVDGDYKKALADLVKFNTKIATDPVVNGGFELVKKETISDDDWEEEYG